MFRRGITVVAPFSKMLSFEGLICNDSLIMGCHVN